MNTNDLKELIAQIDPSRAPALSGKLIRDVLTALLDRVEELEQDNATAEVVAVTSEEEAYVRRFPG